MGYNGETDRPRDITCPICSETVPRTTWHLATLPCCRQVVCWSCVRRHAESVVDDARSDMLCPLARCSPLPDTFVHCAVRRERWSLGTLDLFGSVAKRKIQRYDRWVLSCGLAKTCAARAEDVIH